MPATHDNPIDASDVSDAERAEMLERYVELLEAEFGVRPKLMPLDEEGKAPIIQGKCSLDSPEGDSYLVDAEEAGRRIRETGARGFAIYAGKPSHHTTDIVLVDHDDLDAFPVPTAEPTLTVMSGSGRGFHETYRNAGDVKNAKAKGDIPDAGEVRAHNWYCVTPGSVHPSGGVYHITEENEITTLSESDLPEELRPSVGGGGESDDPIELATPSELENTEFKNELGDSLEEIRAKDDKLNDLLNDLEPSGYTYPSASEADAALVSKLHWWRFTPSDIGNILRKYRNRDNLHENKIDLTVRNFTQGEQCESQPAQQLRYLLDRIEDSDESPDSSTKRRLGDLLGRVEPAEFVEERERAAQALDVTEDAIDRHRGLERHRQEYGPVMVEEGRTWYLSGVPLTKYELLNFSLDVQSFLQVPGEPLRAKLRLRTAEGEEFTKTIEPKIFSQRHRFDDEVLAERFGMTIDTGPRNDDDVLDDINRYISQQDAPTLRGTHQIGLHGSEFVWPDATLGPEGWVNQPETVHVNRDVALERAVSIPTNRSEYDPEDVKRVLTKLPKTRDISRFLPVMAWFYAAPLRPLIFDEWNATAFNHLSVTGDTGSGKTTTLRYLWRCFGIDSDPFDVTDTHFAIVTALSASNGIPVWYDEYKPGDIPDWQLNRFHDNYRKAATGATVTRGNQDQTTTEYHLNAPVVLSGEEQIRPPAERRRSIMVTFRDDVTDRGRETRTEFKELVGSGRVEDGELKLPEGAPDPSDHALAYYQWVTGTEPETLRAKWQDARELVWERWQSWEIDIDLDDMEIQGLQTVAFGWMCMRAFARDHDVPLDALPQEEELDAALRHVAGEIGPDGKRKSHIDRFVELLERAAMVDYLEDGTHYTFVHEGEGAAEELRVKLSTAFDAVSKYVRDHDLGTEDLLSNPSDYRARFKEAAKKHGGYVTAWDQNTPPLNRCVGINTVMAMNELDFNRRSFGVEPDGSETEESESDDGGDDSGAPPGRSGNGEGPALEGARSRVEQHVKAGYSPGDSVDASAVAGKLEIAPDAVEHQLERLAKRKGLLESRESGYVKV